jgi:hypothetical protein
VVVRPGKVEEEDETVEELDFTEEEGLLVVDEEVFTRGLALFVDEEDLRTAAEGTAGEEPDLVILVWKLETRL